jgi:tripartite-type tricarboxylate transporter receptor subunit TctC
MKRPWFPAAAAALLLTAAAATASAQTWPAKPVTLVVPTAPGGGTDLFARLFAERLGPALGQPFVIDNKPGANGMLGTQFVQRAAPDGYTLLFSYAAAQVANPSLYKSANYDPVKDFVPIVQVGRVGNLILVRADSPVKTLKEFVDAVKAKPDHYSYCSWGIGSGGHIAMESLKKQAGIALNHVPYKGNAPCIHDLLGGQVDFAFGDISSNVPHIKAGKLRALAYSGPTRLASLPEVPTMTESGYPFSAYAWYGIFAPAGTPAAIVSRINAEMNKLLADAVIKSRMADVNITDLPQNTPQQFAETVRNDYGTWGAVIRALDIKLD